MSMEKLLSMGSNKAILLTEKAAVKVKELMRGEGKESAYLRVYVAGGGCSGLTHGLALEDMATKEDVVFEEKGVKIVLDNLSARYLFGTEVDYVESLQASGFKISNPNAVSTCGCGQSFHVKE